MAERTILPGQEGTVENIALTNDDATQSKWYSPFSPSPSPPP